MKKLPLSAFIRLRTKNFFIWWKNNSMFRVSLYVLISSASGSPWCLHGLLTFFCLGNTKKLPICPLMEIKLSIRSTISGHKGVVADRCMDVFALSFNQEIHWGHFLLATDYKCHLWIEVRFRRFQSLVQCFQLSAYSENNIFKHTFTNEYHFNFQQKFWGVPF